MMIFMDKNPTFVSSNLSRKIHWFFQKSLQRIWPHMATRIFFKEGKQKQGGFDQPDRGLMVINGDYRYYTHEQ